MGGQLGVVAGSTPNPVLVTSLSGIDGITASFRHSCAWVHNGPAWCWGANSSGQLGDGTMTDSSTPKQVVGLSDVVQMSAGSDATCALDSNGRVSCWGNAFYGALGNGSLQDYPPRVVTGLAP